MPPPASQTRPPPAAAAAGGQARLVMKGSVPSSPSPGVTGIHRPALRQPGPAPVIKNMRDATKTGRCRTGSAQNQLTSAHIRNQDYAYKPGLLQTNRLLPKKRDRVRPCNAGQRNSPGLCLTPALALNRPGNHAPRPGSSQQISILAWRTGALNAPAHEKSPSRCSVPHTRQPYRGLRQRLRGGTGGSRTGEARRTYGGAGETRRLAGGPVSVRGPRRLSRAQVRLRDRRTV